MITEPLAVGHTPDVGRVLGRLRDRGLDVAPSPPDHAETPDDARARRALQQAHRQARSERQVPARYRAARVADLTGAQQAAVLGWLDGGSPTLLLVGPVGTGKTHAGYALRHHAAQHGPVAAFHVADLLRALRPGGDPRDVADLLTCPLLVLDDLGTEMLSDWGHEQMGALWDERLRRECRQVITTNLGSAQLREHLGERVASRLTGGATVLAFTGPDRRRVDW